MDAAPHQNVRRRKVFYISGFDPRGPAHYHALFSAEAQKQSAVNGMEITVGEARRKGRLATHWPIRSSVDGQHVEADYEILRWDDIIRDRMNRSGPSFCRDVARTYWLFIRTGALRRIFKASYPAFLAGLYPIVFLAGFATLATVAAISVYVVFPETVRVGDFSWETPRLLALFLAATTFAAVFRLSTLLETNIPFFWPLHVYAFAGDHMLGRVPEIDARIERFSETILNHVSHCDDEEVLVASHSNGTVLAVSAVASALRRDPDLAHRGPKVSFLTLGENIPLCSFLPQATELRRDLRALGNENGIEWIDITAPRDAACFALTDPLQASGVESTGQGVSKPKLLSVSITELFSARTFRRTLSHRWLRIHFQYIMACERQTPYDYFLITAGPLTLEERFARIPGKDGFARFRPFG